MDAKLLCVRTQKTKTDKKMWIAVICTGNCIKRPGVNEENLKILLSKSYRKIYLSEALRQVYNYRKLKKVVFLLYSLQAC